MSVRSGVIRALVSLSCLAFSLGLTAQSSAKQGLVDLLLEYLSVRYPGTPARSEILYISVQNQRLFHVKNGRLIHEYTISTSSQGLGSEKDSYRTPTGLHYIRERIGEDQPAWSVFRERRCTGELADSCSGGQEDLITSRILWLSGMESGLNAGGAVDSYDRWIYIHGTADECSLGSPSSHGCIRMRNRDIIGLFDRVQVGTLVVIFDN